MGKQLVGLLLFTTIVGGLVACGTVGGSVPHRSISGDLDRSPSLLYSSATVSNFTMFPINHPTALQYITPGLHRSFWFSDQTSNSIGHISRKGVIHEYKIPTPNSGPEGVVLAPDDNVWFAEANNGGKIGRMTMRGVFTEFSTNYPDGRPLAMTVGPDKNIWYTMVQYVRNSQNVIGRITIHGATKYFNINHPAAPEGSIINGPNGTLWFGEYDGYDIYAYIAQITTTGLLNEYAINPTGLLNSLPTGIVSYNDKVYFADSYPNAIDSVTASGAIAREASLGCGGTDELTVASNGMIYAATSCGLIAFSPTTKLVSSPISPPYGWPTFLSGASRGYVWFTEPQNAIGRYHF